MMTRNRRRLAASALAAALAGTMLAACGSDDDASEETSDAEDQSDEAPDDDAESGSESASEAGPDEAGDDDASGPVTITDMVGRTVELDEPADVVFGAGPPATTLLYTFDPDVMAGWNTDVGQGLADYLPEGVADLPVLGRVSGGQGDFDPEVLLAEGVEVIIDAGDLGEEYVDTANELQDLTGIPVVMLSTNPEDLAEAYDILGQVTGETDRADEIGGITEELVAEIQANAAEVPEDERVSVYYGMGEDALSTAGETSIHSRPIVEIGAINAAEIDTGMSGRVDVDGEQVLTWAPDWVVLSPDSPDDLIATEPTAHELLGTLDAFASDQYLVAPRWPFGWVDAPPSVNQLVGMLWMGASIYPDAFDGDLVAQVQDFYSDFYHYEMDEDEATEILTEAHTPGY